MGVKRYELKTKYRGNESWDEMEESPDGMYVRYEDYADSQREFRAADATIENLQMQVEKLAAENAGLKVANAEGCKWDGEQWVGISIQTPATDAFLAEVRAQESKRVYESILDNPAVTDMESLVDWLEQYACDSVAFAAQLRKGVQS